MEIFIMSLTKCVIINSCQERTLSLNESVDAFDKKFISRHKNISIYSVIRRSF